MLKIKNIILLILIILVVSGCNKNCIKSHKEKSVCLNPVCIPNGKTILCYNIMRPCEKTICDEYEKVGDE